MDQPVASAGDDWGYQPGKGGMAIEAKLGMFIILILVGAFGFLVYRNIDQRRQELVASGGNGPVESPGVVQAEQGPEQTVPQDLADDFRTTTEPGQAAHHEVDVPSSEPFAEFSFDDASESASSELERADGDEVAELDFPTDFGEPESFEAAAGPAAVGFDDVALQDPAAGQEDGPWASHDDERTGSFDVATTMETADAEQFTETAQHAANDESTSPVTEFAPDEFVNSDGADLQMPIQLEPSLPTADDALLSAEEIDEFAAEEPDADDNQFAATEDDRWDFAETEREQSAEQAEQPVLHDDDLQVTDNDLQWQDNSEVSSGFDASEAGVPRDVAAHSPGFPDEGFTNDPGDGSVDALAPAEDATLTVPEADSGFEFAARDERSPENVHDFIGTEAPDREVTVPSGPAVLPEQLSVYQPDELNDDMALRDADTAETDALLPVTPELGQQPALSKFSRDDGRFSLPGFAYENRVVTASAETEPSAVTDVLPGDSYWKISRRVYGTPRYFSALALYNQHRIPDPKKLRPGMKVLVPTMEILEQKYPRLFRDSRRPARSPSGYFVRSDGTAAYRIGERDTLSEIAQKHLGRSARWIQIYRLNRAVLSNPNKLKPGTVILLPDDATDVHVAP